LVSAVRASLHVDQSHVAVVDVVRLKTKLRSLCLIVVEV
jgi:hypothetical protein